MKKRYLPIIPLLGLSFTSCIEEQGAVFIEGITPVDYAECSVDPAAPTRQFQGLLDIGGLPDEVNSYNGAAVVTTNLPSTLDTTRLTQERQLSPNYPNYGSADTNVIIFNSARVYFTDERNQPLRVAGVGPETDAQRETALGGSVYNVQTNLSTSSVVLAPLITKEEATSLQLLDSPDLAGIPELAALANDPTNRFRIIAHVRVVGRTTGGAEVVSQEFSYPIDLCQRCLANVGVPPGQTECPAGQTLQIVQQCTPGQDAPTSFCQ